jgi:cobalt-zinc-cadmium efflux system outer membrane protein
MNMKFRCASARRPLLCVTLVATVLAATSSTRAQPPESAQPASTPTSTSASVSRTTAALTLDEAVAEALARNPDLAAARARVREAEGTLLGARRWFPDGPQLEFATARREAPGDDTRDLSIGVSQSVWLAGQGGLAADAARSERKAATQHLASVETRIAAQTRRAFLEVLVAREELITADRLVDTLSSLAGFARRRLEAGAATAVDVNTAGISLAQARAERASAQLHGTRARTRLARLLNRDPAAPLPARGELRAWSVELPGREALLTRAVRRRADLAAASARTEAARARLAVAERGWVPDPRIRAFYEEEESAEILGVGVTLPLPSLRGYRGESKAAAARLDAANVDEDRLRLAVRAEVLDALAAYRAAVARAGFLGTDRMALAQENFDLTMEAWRNGKVAAPALAVAQDRLGRTRRDYLSALDELVAAVTELERATGGLVRLGGAGTRPEQEKQQ